MNDILSFYISHREKNNTMREKIINLNLSFIIINISTGSENGNKQYKHLIEYFKKLLDVRKQGIIYELGEVQKISHRKHTITTDKLIQHNPTQPNSTKY